MKKLMVSLLFLGMASMAMGEVSTRVCLADGNTPFEPYDPNFPHVYPDIMVGTKLTIIVYSTAVITEMWGGALTLEDANMDYGELSARDYNEQTLDYKGSRFEAAGEWAAVWDYMGEGFYGFMFYTDIPENVEAGDWFIIDYAATEIGTCKVCFYDDSAPNPNVPVYELTFSHVRSRDFNQDKTVNFIDFAILASYWGAIDCSDPDWCGGADLDTDGDVDNVDLMLFADYWLERTE